MLYILVLSITNMKKIIYSISWLSILSVNYVNAVMGFWWNKVNSAIGVIEGRWFYILVTLLVTILLKLLITKILNRYFAITSHKSLIYLIFKLIFVFFLVLIVRTILGVMNWFILVEDYYYILVSFIITVILLFLLSKYLYNKKNYLSLTVVLISIITIPLLKFLLSSYFSLLFMIILIVIVILVEYFLLDYVTWSERIKEGETLSFYKQKNFILSVIMNLLSLVIIVSNI